MLSENISEFSKTCPGTAVATVSVCSRGDAKPNAAVSISDTTNLTSSQQRLKQKQECTLHPQK